MLLQKVEDEPDYHSESADEFDEEDIDHIVAEAKRAKKGSKLSSHLTVRAQLLGAQTI